MPVKDLKLPFDRLFAERVVAEFGSPVYIYDEKGIRNTAAAIKRAFSWANDYRNYFAVKALPNPAILKILGEEGMGFDCATRTELVLMQRMGIMGRDIFYTSNNTPYEDFELAIELGATINIDDLTQVPVFIKALNGRSYDRVAVRYNPGDLKAGNDIIGKPTQAKYGMDISAMVKSFNLLKKLDIAEFGLHIMVASNELNAAYFGETAEILLDAATSLEQSTGVVFSFINLGGGYGLNYLPNETPFDILRASELIRSAVERFPHKITLYTENGRYVTGPHGYLLSRIRYVMHKYKTYVGLDASMHNLMRPGMDKSYHHITILGKENSEESQTYDVVGSLCQNNDKFAIDRKLPEAQSGELVVIRDAGAHAHAMGFNFNGLLKSPEILMTKDCELKLIRRGETVNDYFSTIIW
jgi:diaminopimelate decarboxylase